MLPLICYVHTTLDLRMLASETKATKCVQYSSLFAWGGTAKLTSAAAM